MTLLADRELPEHFSPAQDAGKALGGSRSWFLTALAVIIAIALLVLGLTALLQTRNETQSQVEQAASNLLQLLKADIESHFAIIDLALQRADLVLREPGFDRLSRDLQQTALFADQAATRYLSAIAVLDAEGHVLAATKEFDAAASGLGNAAYFQVHRQHRDTGLYVSRPFVSPRLPDDPLITVSRRRAGPDGSFAGIAVGTFRVAYFRELFARFNLGPTGTVALIRDDGWMIVRYPIMPGQLGLDVGASQSFRAYAALASGHVVGVATSDGQQRLFTFQQLSGLKLILAVAQTTHSINQAWQQKAMTIGLMLTVLGAASVSLCLLIRQQLRRRATAERALIEAAERLSVMADTDALTGLLNRRSFESNLRRVCECPVAGQSPLALLMLDADDFKSFNDRYGHQMGDLALQTIARCMQQNTAAYRGICARYGGEEFIALLPQTDAAGALAVAEAIRRAVAEARIDHAASPIGVLTVSLGVATVQPPFLADAGARLIKQADDALYEAKRQGRDRVVPAGRELRSAGRELRSAGREQSSAGRAA